MAKVLIAEPLADAGVELLRTAHEVDARTAMTREELLAAVAGVEALVVRSATRVDAEVLEAGRDLKVVGRAGIGLDNVDGAAATRLGIMVVNAPQSNVISAAEHTVALILAQVRNIPQAHAALREGRWERILAGLREQERLRQGRNPTPSAVVLDSQSVKTTEKGGHTATTAPRS